MYRVRQTLEATTADVSVSRLLERDESQPLLRIKGFLVVWKTIKDP